MTTPCRARTGGRYRYLLLCLLCLAPVLPLRAQPGRLYHESRQPVDALRAEPPGALAAPVTLRYERPVPVEEVLREIGRQAGLVVVFDTDRVAALPPVRPEPASVSAAEALGRVLRGTGLRAYRLADGKVLVAPAAQPGPTSAVPVAAPEAQGQVVRGRVVDRDTQTPLPGANVVVLGTDPLLGTATDADGLFVLPGVPLGRHDVQASFIGYEPVLMPGVLVTAGKEVVLEIGLKEQVVEGQEVVVVPEVVKERPLNDMALVSARTFSVEETRRYAGGVDDPARMAAAFAGVAGGAGVSDNAVVIRGNAPKGVLWRLEGVEIPNPNHFAGMSVVGGGGLTLFSSQLLADSDFLTGAFPAEYGNAMAGVFDMSFRTGNPVRREHAFQAGLLGLEASSEGPFRLGRPATYLFNFRYSTIALLMPLLPTEDVAKYADLSFKLSFPTRRAGRFEVWGIGGMDSQSMAANPDSSEWEYELWDRVDADLSLGVGAAGLSHQLVLGRRTYLRSSAAVTFNRTRWSQERLNDDVQLQPDLFFNSDNSRLIVGSYLNHKFGRRHVNRTGFTVQQLFYDFNLDADLVNDGDWLLETLTEGRGNSTLLQGYTQSQFDLTSRLALTAGVHAQHFALTGRTSVEPRASLRWQFAGSQALSLGYGLHSQIEELRLYFARVPAGDEPASPDRVMPNRKLDFTKAHHAVVGYDLRLGEAARLKLEGYYQSLFDVPVVPDSAFSLLNFEQDWTFQEPLVGAGAGRNYGVEATVERFLRGGYYYLATASVFRSRYRGGDGVWRGTRFDQGYAVNGLFGKEFALGERGNLLGLNARLALVGGKRRSPVDLAASRAREEVVYDTRRAFTDREPALVLLDATVTYRINRRRFAEVWALQVKNVLATKEVALDYNFATGMVDEVRDGYPLPVLSYKIVF